MYKYTVRAMSPVFFDVDIEFTESGEVKSIHESYTSLSAAKHKVLTHLKTWLVHQIKKYINHSRFLIDMSLTGYYMTRRRADAIHQLNDYLKIIDTETLRNIVFQIQNYEAELRAILPYPKNNSYQSSLDRLEEIILICSRMRKYYKSI